MPFFTAYVMAVFKMNELSDELIHCPAYLHFFVQRHTTIFSGVLSVFITLELRVGIAKR